MPSREKIYQLTSLFGCEYREGRASSSPQFRPDTGATQKDGHLPDAEVMVNEEADEPPAHDMNVLPHMYAEEEGAILFPNIEAAPIGPNVEDWVPEGDIENKGAAKPAKKPRGVLRVQPGALRGGVLSRAEVPAPSGARRGLLRIA